MRSSGCVTGYHPRGKSTFNCLVETFWKAGWLISEMSKNMNKIIYLLAFGFPSYDNFLETHHNLSFPLINLNFRISYNVWVKWKLATSWLQNVFLIRVELCHGLPFYARWMEETKRLVVHHAECTKWVEEAIQNHDFLDVDTDIRTKKPILPS